MADALIKILLALTAMAVLSIVSISYGELRGVRMCNAYDFTVGSPEIAP